METKETEFHEKWKRIRMDGYSTFYKGNILKYYMIVLLILFVFIDHTIFLEPSFAIQIFVLSLYFVTAFFIASFAISYSWRRNERKYNQLR